ncbi:hypothetical protein LTR78_010562 [Recurvomyces mirabilis]|uniref:ABC transporter domain-containing protein n=1 Tax=Recurvomyces mirabilis TaxID=574656 RepID=A0AAE0WGT8_9PEZI|nr:hypothetical protein LTR78_010562 [Recurvomyces mirabilis]KAK5160794.1 hypothetical protein LTS14_001807 [Recurvomyces mirabilis]
MWRRSVVWQVSRSSHTTARAQQASRPIIHIDNATLYRQYPSANEDPGSNPPLLSNLNFSLPSEKSSTNAQNWSVISPSSLARTTFLQALAGQHICVSPTARTYPYLSDISQSPQHAIKYVGFDAERGSSVGGTSVRGAYLSARYESRREETDFSVLDYLTGHTELNALEESMSENDRNALDEITEQLNLRQLLRMPVANLSNGQTRRARIAKALMAKPEVLLLDGPFMGLDPNTLRMMSGVLRQLAERQQPRLIMSLRPEDGVPSWVSHLVIVDQALKILAQGPKHDLVEPNIPAEAATILHAAQSAASSRNERKYSRDGFHRDSPALSPGDALVEMQGVKVAYGDKVVLGDWSQEHDNTSRSGLWWSLHRGQRCAILGPNGSGKTTMLSLITSDHPQTYSLPIKLFGRSRLPGPGQPGISLFELQQRMGHSSPEVHAFFPKQLTVRRALESAWSDAPLAKPKLPAGAKERVDACLRWFEQELNPRWRNKSVVDVTGEDKVRNSTTIEQSDSTWAAGMTFRDLSFSNQRLILFIRAIVAEPDLVILDEALSGIDEATRDKALLFLSQGENVVKNSKGSEHNQMESSEHAKFGRVTVQGLSSQQALLVISHSKEDVPGCIREWIRLPEPGEGRVPKIGRLSGPLELNPEAWEEIWS